MWKVVRCRVFTSLAEQKEIFAHLRIANAGALEDDNKVQINNKVFAHKKNL